MEQTSHDPVIIKIQHDVDTATRLCAYVVNAAGNITETAAFEDNVAKLRTEKHLLDGATKVYIGKAIPQDFTGNANERLLIKSGAYETVKKITGNVIDITKIPASVFGPWFWNNCLITGHVNKNFNIDGQIKNLPVCNARVHICEVETELRWPHIPIYRRRIPDWVINEIGQKFREIVVKPVPQPDPIGPVSQFKRRLELRSLGKAAPFNDAVKLRPSLPPLADNIMEAMTSGSVDLIRKGMRDYHEFLYPYFCLWPIYWPWIYVIEEETVVETDCNGHFEKWENTFTEDGPLNIYIWVEVFIGGSWVTVYRPSIPCNTWWNYQCNTDINIRITDPRVQPCDCGVNGPADAVWFRSIGTSASALHIEQDTGSTISLQSAILKNGGCTDIIDTNKQKVSPFGSNLVLKLFCGANIFAAGVTHYRWKKTRVTDANQNPVSGSTTIITGNVYRPYLVKMSAVHYETHYCALGAEGSGTDLAYRIPHHDVTLEPVSSLQDPADTGRNPEWESQFFDSASFDSHSLNDGIYKFELELLKLQGGSFVVVPVAKQTFQISQYSTIGDNQDAPDVYLNLEPGNKASAYKMNVRIDNAPCNGDIHDAVLNETGAPSGPCGFIHYGNTGQHVHISFEASHPRNFATFDFGIVKGNGTQPTGIHPSGYVLSGVPVGGIPGTFNLAGGIFSHDFTVLELLNGCIGQAAFSENLHVAALATDGSERLYGFDYHDPVTDTNRSYDAGDVNAFALSNT